MTVKMGVSTACVNKINCEGNKYFKMNSNYFQEFKMTRLHRYNSKSLASPSVFRRS